MLPATSAALVSPLVSVAARREPGAARHCAGESFWKAPTEGKVALQSTFTDKTWPEAWGAGREGEGREGWLGLR